MIMSTGFGADIWCYDGLKTGRYARGKALVAQALYRRLITPRGTLRGGPEEDAYGFDVAGYLGSVGTDTAVAALPVLIGAELRKDDRVANVSVAAPVVTTSTDGTAALRLEVSVETIDDGEDFVLTVGISAVSVEMLGVK